MNKLCYCFGASSTLTASGAITLAAGSQIATAATLALEPGTDFINQAGPSAIATSSGGNWVIYSQSPDSDTFGGLASGNPANWGASPAMLNPASLSGNQYVFSEAPTVTIAANNLQNTYGNALSAANLTYTVSGLVDASQYGAVFLQDSVSGTPLISSPGAVATANVGAYTISAGPGSLVVPSGYSVAYSGGTLVVNPAQLTLAAVSQTKTYDGTTVSIVTPIAAGLVNGNTVSNLTQSFDSTSAGARTLSVNGGFVVNDGDGGADYVVSLQTAAGSITPLAISAALTGSVTKAYDGTTTASLAPANYVLTGVLAGDSVVLNDPVTGTFDTKDADTGKVISVSGLALSGAQAGDYTVNAATSAAIGIIDPLAITAALTGSVSRTANGSTAATLSADNFVLDGLVSGESASITQTVGQYATASAGSGITVSVTLTASDFSPGSGTSLSNYILPTGTISAPIGTITPQVIVAVVQPPSAPIVVVPPAAPVPAPAPAPAAPAPAPSDAPVPVAPVIASAGSSVAPSPPTPVPAAAPPTPPDSEDAADPVLASVSVPVATPAPHGRRQSSVTVPLDGGLLGVERTIPQPSGRLPGVDDEFSGSGRGF